jgi:hypothetical protein
MVVLRILRYASLAICVIAIASFVGFAAEQSKAGSNHQVAEVNAASPSDGLPSVAPTSAAKPGKSDKSAFRNAIDDVFAKVASPFTGLTKSISSPWTSHIVNTLLVLLIYGFGLGFLARTLRFGD